MNLELLCLRPFWYEGKIVQKGQIVVISDGYLAVDLFRSRKAVALNDEAKDLFTGKVRPPPQELTPRISPRPIGWEPLHWRPK